jgi:DNA-directed RNA polymerase specialized sigma24 family protein
MGFDNTVDNRWRPDFEASRRRVHEEEAEERVVYSRELSLVPARRPAPEHHDAQTRALIEQHARMEKLPHGSTVASRLEAWQWMDRMKSPEEKQAYLEPLIESVRRDPVAHEDLLVFLLIAFEPARRGVSKEFCRLHAGLRPAVRDVNWSNRAEARMIREIDKQQLYDVTRAAAIEAIFRYPTPCPDRLFPWMRETIAHRALDELRGELPEIEAQSKNPAEARALQEALAGFDAVEPPPMREVAGMREWKRRVNLRHLYEIVDDYFGETAVRSICNQAVGRLPRCQAEVINGVFFEQHEPETLATLRDVSPSTIYNQKATAQRKLREDDSFFFALFRLGAVRDRARAQSLAEKYPDGRLPDGRRIVHIGLAA